MTPFDPTQDPKAFRMALGSFTTGVTIVTTGGETPVGITANSFSSVSLDPPLVLWSVAKSSARAPAFTEAEHFAIHVLASHQADTARAFATEADAFGDLTLRPHPNGVPVFDDCLAQFDCTRHAVHDAGDHWLILGRVTAAARQDAPPLVFHAGQFKELP